MLLDQRRLADSRAQGADRNQAQNRTRGVMLSYTCLTCNPHSLGVGGSEQKPNTGVSVLRLWRSARVQLSLHSVHSQVIHDILLYFL